MRVKDIFISSSNKHEQLHLSVWMPESEPRLIVQITHGMVEHIGRYSELADFLCSRNIGVVGHDTLGHGGSVHSTSQMGYFGAKHGDRMLICDIGHVTSYIRKKYPGCPVVLLGHSMGSFTSRRFIELKGSRLDGCILMGTGWYGKLTVGIGKFIASFLRVARGNFYRSGLLKYLMLDSNYKFFKDYQHKSWLTCDDEEALKYSRDELCGFDFTVSAYIDFFRILLKINSVSELRKIPKKLPVLLLSGEDDPVGNFGKGVSKVFGSFRQAGIHDVEMKLYPGMRHELIHETEKEKVFSDIYEWLNRRF